MSEFAWVTLATNDSYSLGALVLAHSLKQVGTKHQLAVLITPGVTSAMREKLTAVFNLVEEVNPLDSKDAANLKLLKRPELGITFTKLHCWRLVQFQKCVFLDADTLVLSNSDELFDREEFSAAPDVGWPDCFNSGVFVYKPSNETYSKLVDFALVKGSFDGGDQGLLNLYFSDWAHKDIAKHLPFIYNMCSTAVYSYLPAFKQYGKNAKIVHFIGPAKPWLQYFNTENLTVYPSPGLQHLEDVLQKWWNIFCSLIHPNLSRDMAGSKQSAEHIPSTPNLSSQSQNIQVDYNFTEEYANNVWDPWDEYDNRQLLERSADCEQSVDENVVTESFPFNDNSNNRNNNQNECTPSFDGDSNSEVVNQINYDQPENIDIIPQNIELTFHVVPQNVEQQTKSFSIPDDCDSSELNNYLEPTVNPEESCLTHDIQIDNVEPPVEVPSRNPIPSELPIVCTPSSTVSQELASLHANHNNDADAMIESGLAGAFAQFTLGAKRSAGQDALENHLRRQAWEVGNIDYLGRDSFDHIWTKICESMSAPVRESVPQPTAESKVETKAVEAIGDIPTADTIQEISCTAGPVQAAEEKPSLPKPDVEPPKVETTSVVAEELKPLEVSAQTIPEGVPPVVLKQPEVTEVPKTDEPAPSEEPKIVTQPPSIAPQEPAVLASTDIAPTSPAPGITAGETPKVADIQTTQAVETTLAVLVETGKVDVPTGTPTDLPKLEATVQDSLPSEAPKTEAAPGKIETPSTESPKIEPEPTKTEAASKPDTPVTEPIPTTPSEVKTPETTQAETPKSEPIKVGEIVSTIVTPPTPTDATKTDTPISEDVPQIISPAVPSETTPTPEPIPLPQPIPLTEPIAADVPKSEVDQQKEVPMEGVPAVKTASEPQKQEDVIPKEPAIAAEVPKKAEDSVLKKDDQVEKKEECPVKTEEVKSEPIPSEILQSAEVVALKETETPKVEAEVPKVESEAPKVEAETLKTEAEAPKVEVEAQKVETISPKLEAEAPKVEAETPKVAAEVPKVEPEAPKVETVIPKAGTETPKVEAEPLKVEAEVPKVEVEATKVEAEVPKVEGEALKVEPETPKAEVEVSKPGETAEQKAEGTKPEGAEGVQEKPKKKIVKKVKKVPKTEAGGPKAEAASSEEQPEVAGGETSMPTPPPRKTTTVKKVKAKKP